jgi:alpha-ketoglutarate-dependent taurine dioxygenase
VIKHERQRLISTVAFRPADGTRDSHIPTWDAGGCGLQLAAWLDQHAEVVTTVLREHGAALTAVSFAGITGRLCGAPIVYRERTTPRRPIGDASTPIYTSTEYPRDQEIFLHNENAYASCWPEYLCFYCAQPAQAGGETPLADLRQVEAALSPELMRGMQARGLLHRRTFIDGVGINWQQAFGVETLDELELRCRENGIELAAGERVRVEYRHAPRARHPRTSEPCWFNHAAFFQADKLEASLAAGLHQMLGPEELPNRILYGDGTSLETPVITELTRAYRAAAVPHAWRTDDLVVLDNMRYAHGRRPFVGPRSVWVSMANELKRSDLLA